MPRAEPVTRAVRPESGATQSATGSGVAPVTSTTWPLTYADRGERRKRRVDPADAAAPGTIRTSCTVAPRPISLPSERTNPSSACCAAAWWWSSGDGVVPRTTTRPLRATERTTGCSAAWRAASPGTVVRPVASTTMPHGPDRLLRPLHHRQAETVEQLAHLAGDGRFTGREVQHLPVERGRLQRPAAQRHGLGEAEVAGEETAGCCAGQVQIAVGHCPDSLLGRRFTPE